MSRPVRPLALVAVAAGLAAAGAAHQPTPKPPEPFTAFPELKVLVQSEWPLGMNDDKIFGRLQAGHPRAIPADAPPLRRVKIAQLNEGADHVIKTWQVMRVGKWAQTDYFATINVTMEAYQLGAELADTREEKLGWYVDRVVMLKTFEQYFAIRMESGTEPPQVLHVIRFYRLRAEAELLELKARLGKK